MATLPKTEEFKFIRQLGEGGTAVVWLAIDKKIGRQVAIKILEPTLLKSNSITRRFIREAKIAAKLQHTNIIQIYDIKEIDGDWCIVMEHLEESLRNRINDYPNGIVAPDAALAIIGKIMPALDYSHFSGIYHRDIKPENIMFRKDGTLVLVDFGIARSIDSDTKFTKSGTIMGTTDYMSPEQCKGKREVDGRSDIYSLGVILYEMLSGKKPYAGKTQISIALQQIEKPPPRLPEELQEYQPLIDRMMAKDVKDRFSSAAQFMVFCEENIPLTLSAPIPSLPEQQPTDDIEVTMVTPAPLFHSKDNTDADITSVADLKKIDNINSTGYDISVKKGSKLLFSYKPLARFWKLREKRSKVVEKIRNWKKILMRK